MSNVKMLHDIDPKEKLKAQIGDLTSLEVFNNQVVIAIYTRPERTKGGIFLTPNAQSEDKIQSKVGLVVKMGPEAFMDERGKWFADVEINVGDWVVFRPSEGWNITINDVACRMLDDVNIRCRVQNPDMIW